MTKAGTSAKAETGRSCLRYGVALTALGVFAYLCWRASPWLHQVPWMPEWLGRWGDRHGDFRNMPAFGVLALVLIWALGRRVGGGGRDGGGGGVGNAAALDCDQGL